MPYTQTPDPSKLEPILYSLTVEALKWYAAFLTDKLPTRKGELATLLTQALTNSDRVRQLWGELTPAQQHVIGKDVYRLTRDQILEAADTGLGIRQIKEFLGAKSGQPEDALPQTVRVFFADVEKRLGGLREAGRMVVLEGDDPFLLTELSNNPSLRALVRLGAIGDKTVLLVPEEQEAAVRRNLKKLGYIPRKG